MLRHLLRVGLGIGYLDQPMLWSNSHGLWQTLENIVNTDKSAAWEYTHSSKQKSLIVVLGLLGIMILKPDFQFFNQVKRKLLQESGHPRIVL